MVTIPVTEPAPIASATMVMEHPKAAPIVTDPVIHAAPVMPLPPDVAALQRRVAELEARILELERTWWRSTASHVVTAFDRPTRCAHD